MAADRGVQKRSIPAWAGETHGIVRTDIPLTVYPRVGGGNDAASLELLDNSGLSPRGRGKHAGIASRRRG